MSRTQSLTRTTWFSMQWLFIGAVSAYDAYLVALFADMMPEHEQNPMGRYIMELSGGGVSTFIVCKLAGTVFVLVVLASLWRNRSRITFPVVSSLSSFQAWLLCYLTFA